MGYPTFSYNYTSPSASQIDGSMMSGYQGYLHQSQHSDYTYLPTPFTASSSCDPPASYLQPNTVMDEHPLASNEQQYSSPSPYSDGEPQSPHLNDRAPDDDKNILSLDILMKKFPHSFVRRIGTDRTRNASESRRGVGARFACRVDGCGGSFTSKHALNSKPFNNTLWKVN